MKNWALIQKYFSLFFFFLQLTFVISTLLNSTLSFISILSPGLDFFVLKHCTTQTTANSQLWLSWQWFSVPGYSFHQFYYCFSQDQILNRMREKQGKRKTMNLQWNEGVINKSKAKKLFSILYSNQQIHWTLLPQLYVALTSRPHNGVRF